ncbi:hypothetical protein DE146DRAFT_673931 [Phaeosphaeria sp. MPI-PUGE-AT-0046c]|nr:hypothetical protein DE146DRAFT_673931 [Phaeosphaeria sp. MPI-PUGE-AT-0046c]
MNAPSPIACLESYINPSLTNGPFLFNNANTPALHLLSSTMLSRLKNVGPARVKEMRALGQSMQILSHIPIAANAATCTRYNDALFAAIQLNSEKLAALAILPADGKEAARELQRCVTKINFVGGVVGLQPDGRGGIALGNELEELWSVADRFRVPIMLRDMWPVGAELPTFQCTLPESVLAPVATHLHTSHNHSPLPLLHLYLTGVFDRHANLRLILPHPCLIPSLLPRIEAVLSKIPATDKPKRGYLNVWQQNIYVTTADVLDMSTMRTLLEQIPVDRVLYASNYPLEDRGRELMQELKESEFLTEEEWERVAWGNAELVFGMKSSARKGKGKIG